MVYQRLNYQKYTNPNPIQRFLIERFHERVDALLKSTGVRRILDAGCGEGFVDEYLLSHSGDLTLLGLDVDEEALALGREINPQGHFLPGDIYCLPFADGSFPLILCTQVLEHLVDPPRALGELARVTAEYVLFSAPNGPLFRMANLLRLKNIASWGEDPEHLHSWMAWGFLRLLRGYFEVEKVVSSFPWIIALCRKRNER